MMRERGYEVATKSDLVLILIIFALGFLFHYAHAHAQITFEELSFNNSFVAQVCCKNEAPSVCWNKDYEYLKNDYLGSCVLIHEEDHIRWLNKNKPNICEGKKDGHNYFGLTLAEVYETECHAYAIEFPCLLGGGYFKIMRGTAKEMGRMYGCDFDFKFGINPVVSKLLRGEKVECIEQNKDKKE